MPVEIRELIIKTEISTQGKKSSPAMSIKDLNMIKRQLTEEFRRMISENTKKKSHNR